MHGFSDKVQFIWNVADLLRGVYKRSQYGRVVLPFTVLRRLDQVLAPTREAVWAADEKFAGKPEGFRHKMLLKAAQQDFYNTSRHDFAKLIAQPKQIAANLSSYIERFSPAVRDILDKLRVSEQIAYLQANGLLFMVMRKFAEVDLHPHALDASGQVIIGDNKLPKPAVSNVAMGYIFEELIRKFSEQSNETAGEHFTPRDVIHLMVSLLFDNEAQLGAIDRVFDIYDPACGTGGMLAVAEEELSGFNTTAKLRVHGQELNGESFAICKADMLIKGQTADQIAHGNSFSQDAHAGLKADYLISNPPFGVDWSKAADFIRDEHADDGYAGRFGPGLPRKNDGSLLFLLHMLSKMKPVADGGSRLAIVFNGSPLFTGAAGSGESEIRRWILENDWLETIVALPDQMFYNTGISTYIWILSNRKSARRRGKVQLINGVDFFEKMRKSLGDKRKQLSPQHIEDLVRLYSGFEAGPRVKIFKTTDFGYQRITVERPLQLNFQASAERVAQLEDESAWQKLLITKKKREAGKAAIAAGTAVQASVRAALARLDADVMHRSRPPFMKALKAALKAQFAEDAVKVPAGVVKAVVNALSERDTTAAVCQKKGAAEPDTSLRDHENVPLDEDIDAYMAREVLPHVPDAWVDASKTKIGYEIPFTRHFYVYEPPRDLKVIEGEIRDLEREIQGLLSGVLG